MKKVTNHIVPGHLSFICRVFTATFIIVLAAIGSSFAQNTFVLKANSNTASWQNPQNWENNAVPVAGAAVEIRVAQQAPAVVSIQDIPATMQLASLSIQVANESTVILEAPAQAQVVLGGQGTAQALFIPRAAQVILAGGQSSWLVRKGSTATIEGTLSFAGGAQAQQSLVGEQAGAVVFKKGSVCAVGAGTQAYAGIAFGASKAGAVVFEAGSRLVQYSGAALAAQPQALVFEAGSVFEYAATAAQHSPVLGGYAFADVLFNANKATIAAVKKDFSAHHITVAQGTVALQATAQVAARISGNIALAGTKAALQLGAEDGQLFALQLQGSQAQSITGSGEVLVRQGAQLIVANCAVVNLHTQIEVVENATAAAGANAFGLVEVQDGGRLNLVGEHHIYGNGRFTLGANATLGIGSKNGIYLERNQVGPRVLETELGNVRSGTLQTRVFAATAHYIYMGAEAQETGTGLPINTTWRGTSLPRPRLTIATQADDVEVRLTRSARTSIFTLEKGLFSTHKEGVIPALRIMGYSDGTTTEPGLVIATGGNLKPEASVLEFQGPVQVQAAGTLHFFDVHLMNTATWAANGGANTDFGATGNPIIEGTLFVNQGTRVVGHGPAYSTTSVEGGSIIYQTTVPAFRGMEWAPKGDRGFPNNVWIRHRSVLLAAGAQGAMQKEGLSARGTVRVFASAAMTLQHDDAAMQLPLVVGANLLAEGAFTGSVRAQGNVVIGAAGAVNIAAGGNELLAHDLLIDGQLNAAAQSRIQLNGSWVRNVATGRFAAATSTVAFVGHENASIALTEGTAADTETFYGLELRKQNLATRLRLDAPVAIAHQLTLATGTIETDAARMLSIERAAADAVVTTANGRTAMVSGPMQRATAAGGAYLFPVGKWSQGVAQLRHFSLTEVSAADVFTAEYFAAATPASTTFENKLAAIKAHEYWNISRTGAATAVVVLPYERHVARTWINAAGSTTAPQDKEGVEVWAVKESNAGQWNFAAGVHTPNAGRAFEDYGTVATAMQQSFGVYTLGYSAYRAINISIPMFTAVLKGADALLSWKVEDTDKKVRSIEVEYSADGDRFAKLASLGSLQQSYLHKSVTPGVHYYRILVLDEAGRKLYSKVEMVTVELNLTLITGLVQNPVTGGQAVVRVFSKINQQADAVLIDMNGRQVMSRKVSLAAGENRTLVPMANIAAGTYRLLVRTQDGIEKALPLVLLY